MIKQLTAVVFLPGSNPPAGMRIANNAAIINKINEIIKTVNKLEGR